MKPFTMQCRYKPIVALVGLVLGTLALQGCPGDLSILLGGSNSDDDDTGPELNYDSFEGVEFVNIDWDQETRPQGVEDCHADWYALGTDATVDNQELCPDCGQIWSVELTPLSGADDCLQGTALAEPEAMVVRLGFQFVPEAPNVFTIWRSLGDEPMSGVGVGAINEASAEFTWSGQESFRNDGALIGYEWFLSGEGRF